MCFQVWVLCSGTLVHEQTQLPEEQEQVSSIRLTISCFLRAPILPPDVSVITRPYQLMLIYLSIHHTSGWTLSFVMSLEGSRMTILNRLVISGVTDRC